MQRIKKRIYNSSYFREFICPGKAGEQIQISGVTGSLRSIFVAFLVEKLEKWVVFVTSDLDSAERLHDDLSLLLDKTKVSFFPPAEAAPYEDQDANPSLVRLRLEAQLNLLNNDSGVVVATHQGLLQYMQTPEDFVDHQFHINKSKEHHFEDLISGLVAAGYERCDVVEDVGHLAVRGGIIDIYPWTNDDPVRIEFFGNVVESIRTFNVVSQRSIEEIDQISILPRQEGDQLVSLFEYLDDKAVFAIEDYTLIKEKSKEYHEQIADSYEKHIQASVFPAKPDEKYLSLNDLQKSMENFPHIRFDLVQNTNIPVYHIGSTAPPTFAGHLGRFFSYLKKQASEKNTVFIQCDSRPQEERISEILEDEGHEGLATIMVGALHNGFIFNEENLHVITDHELYDRFKKRRTYKRFRNGEYLRSLNAMNVNDYIVHIDYGVGQYKGLETIDSGTSRRECIKVVYEDGDSLFVSVDRLNRVQKYASDEDVTPRLTRLGSGEWDRLKKRTKESIQKIATELIKINAERKFHKGHAFSADTHWQKELEASFPYEETQDQSRSIYDVKNDLEKETPMDRLLCGDVGYGKTEVALRAAF